MDFGCFVIIDSRIVDPYQFSGANVSGAAACTVFENIELSIRTDFQINKTGAGYYALRESLIRHNVSADVHLYKPDFARVEVIIKEALMEFRWQLFWVCNTCIVVIPGSREVAPVEEVEPGGTSGWKIYGTRVPF